ncbi:MAG: hypothetical protein VW683_00360 [Betaproteobacteria bacterium]|jgi:hypothetical protein
MSFSGEEFDIFRDTTFGPFTDHSDGGFGEFQHSDIPSSFNDNSSFQLNTTSPEVTTIDLDNSGHSDVPHSDGHSDISHSDHTDYTPHGDSLNHSDASHADIPHSNAPVNHSDHNDVTGESHANTTEIYHSDAPHSDNTIQPSTYHVDSGQIAHSDHSDANIEHIDVPQRTISTSPPRVISLKWEPGDTVPDIYNLIWKQGESGNRVKEYTVTNNSPGDVRIKFLNIPTQLMTVEPINFIVEQGQTETITVTVLESRLSVLSEGIYDRQIQIEVRILGDTIAPDPIVLNTTAPEVTTIDL